MQKVKEITVFLENRPGTLSLLTEALGTRGVNVLGFHLTNSLDHGALRLVVDDPATTIHLLEERNMLVLEHDVLAIRLRNEPGALTGLAKALSGSDVNIDYAYGSAAQEKGTAALYVRVSDIDLAERILSGVDGVE